MPESRIDSQFQQFLETFPPTVRGSLQTILQTGGMLSAKHCRAVIDVLNISAEILMQRLLPMAKLIHARVTRDGVEEM